jgi:hypothetical protein
MGIPKSLEEDHDLDLFACCGLGYGGHSIGQKSLQKANKARKKS